MWFRRYFEQGQPGVCAWHDADVVGYVWAQVCSKKRCRVHGYLDVGRDEAVLHSSYVREDMRGKNMYPAMMVSVCQRLFSERKVSRILVDVATHKGSALRSMAKTGFSCIGTGTYVQFCGYLVFSRFETSAGAVLFRVASAGRDAPRRL